jgi:hypothetical protein
MQMQRLHRAARNLGYEGNVGHSLLDHYDTGLAGSLHHLDRDTTVFLSKLLQGIAQQKEGTLAATVRLPCSPR